MAEDAYYLSADDVSLLREIREWWSSKRGYELSRVRGGGSRYPLYRLCAGQVVGDLSSTAATATVDNVVPLVGPSPTTGSTERLTVSNTFKLRTVDNAACKFFMSCATTSTDWELEEVVEGNFVSWGKLDGALSAGGSATVSLWAGGADSGTNVTAYDWLLAGGTSLSAGAKVKVEWFMSESKWYITAAEC